jgi:hypothetical protein
MMVTHTTYLDAAAKEFKAKGQFRGEFHTLSQGRDYGHDINCFMFPCKDGAWAIRRYGQGTKEHDYWVQDGKGWTRCYYNRDLTLDDVARLYGAIELEGGGYQFASAKIGSEALLKIGVDVSLPVWITGRIFKVKETKDYKLAVHIPKEDSDNAEDMKGWQPDRKLYKRIFNNPRSGVPDESVALADYDDLVRHIISEAGEDLGWVINAGDGIWRHEPINHVRVLLTSKGISRKDSDIILGSAISSAWTIVNRPFEGEYPGDRQWNRSSASLRIAPSIEGETLSFPTWTKILDHCGKSLDSAIQKDTWCKANGIENGAAYLKLWLACLIRHPRSSLPYLGFYGPQDSGKSTFHEAFCQIILNGGYMRADTALTSTSGFNGELEDSIFCIIEETDVRGDNKNTRSNHSYNRLKDWVTSNQINIHRKGATPYMVPNYTHWVQCANEQSYIPVFQGDTRVTVLYVDTLPNDVKVPKRELWAALTKEAPDFLSALLNMDIPDSRDRLMLPVIRSAEKEAAEFNNMGPVDQFLKECTFQISGNVISAEDLYNEFLKWIGMEEGMHWNKNKFGRAMPHSIPRGRVGSSQQRHYGNISLNKDALPTDKLFQSGLFLVKEKK